MEKKEPHQLILSNIKALIENSCSTNKDELLKYTIIYGELRARGAVIDFVKWINAPTLISEEEMTDFLEKLETETTQPDDNGSK